MTAIPPLSRTAIIFLLLCGNGVEAFSSLSFVGASSSRTSSSRRISFDKKPSKSSSTTISTTALFAYPGAPLKPAAVPLMAAGKALARAGELLIDVTQELDLYGGGLSAAGAELRNAGDSLAQAAASARFKTGLELVIEELREGGTCLTAAAGKLQRAKEEAAQDEDVYLERVIAAMRQPMTECGATLEESGYTVLRRESPAVTGQALVRAGQALEQVSPLIGTLIPAEEGSDDGNDTINAKIAAANDNSPPHLFSAQRMAYAAQQLIEAGQLLQQAPAAKKRPAGKAWIKGNNL